MTNAAQPETVFTLTIDAQEIRVRYRPYYINGLDPYALLEFTSPHKPRRRIPVSESGYRSFFAPMYEIENAPSVEKYASMVAVALAGESGPRVLAANQLTMS
jgi:hypothetical protein